MVARLLPLLITTATSNSVFARQLFLSPAQSVPVKKISSVLIAAAFALFCVGTATVQVYAQKDKPPLPTSSVARTITRHENHRLSYGGTVTILGAPSGSITIEGWDRNEFELTAEIELHAPTGADLDLLARVNNFAVDVDVNHIRIVTTGTHDKKFMRQVAKNFPRTLFGLPWKIDFHLKVPALTDLEIDSGSGPIKLMGVEGATRLTAFQTDAQLSLTGGYFSGIIQRGTVNVTIPVRSWHGLGATIQLAAGTLVVALAQGFSGDIDASVLRLGEIKNSYSGLEARDGGGITPRLLQARTGAGGAKVSFTIGDGIIQIKSTN